MTIALIRKAKNGKCGCSEGFIATEYVDSIPQQFEPTGLYVHNCEYIKLRNSKLREAENLADALDIPFLKAMDMLMKYPNEKPGLTAFRYIKEAPENQVVY